MRRKGRRPRNGLSTNQTIAMPGGVDAVGDAVVAAGYYGGRWFLNRLRGRLQGSTDPMTLPLAEPEASGPSGNIRVVPGAKPRTDFDR